MDSSVAQKIDRFFASYPLRHFDKGQILIYARDEPSGIFYLTKGTVRQYDISPTGEEVVVNVFKPPVYFPMSWAINRTANQYFFETTSAVNLRQAPVDETLNFFKANPDVVFDLLARVYSGMDGLLRRMAHLMGGSARSRVLFELINASRRFGEPQKSGSYRVAIQEKEIAARSGLTRETVSRELQEFKKMKLLSVSRGGLQIKSLSRLESLLGDSL